VVVVVVEGRLVWWCASVCKKGGPSGSYDEGPTLHQGKKGPCSLSLLWGDDQLGRSANEKVGQMTPLSQLEWR
jgi:hypothetical protein